MAGLIWITNAPAPYRIPVWRALSRLTNFRVLLMAGNEHNRHWSTDALTDIQFRILKTVKVRRSEATHYLSLWPDWIPTLSKADTVILPSWENPLAWQILLAAKLMSKETIGFYESTLLTQRHNAGMLARIRRLFFNLVDQVLTVGTSSTRAILAMGVSEDKIIRGFNAVDVEEIEARAKTTRRIDTNEVRPGHHFIYCGQLIARKNVDLLIEAFSSMQGDEDRLTIVGDGPQLAELNQLAAKLGVAAQVNFAGYVNDEDVPAKMAVANTLTLVSSEEVWGLVVNEGLACGLQIVVTDRCGVTTEIHDLPGVFVCQAQALSIAGAMKSSKGSWNGYRDHPNQMSPNALAEAIATRTKASSRSHRLK